MCGCEWNYVCTRCQGTPPDWRYWLDQDAGELEQQRRDQERTHPLRDEPGLTRATR